MMAIQSLITQAFNKKAHSPGVYQGARHIKWGQRGKRIVFFPSYKNALSMPCDSKLEEDHCLLLEYLPKVVRYRTQPFTLSLTDNQTYTPDVLIEKEDGSYSVVEVKVSATLEHPEIRKKLSIVKTIFEKSNISFLVITEKEIHKKSNHENRKELYRHLRTKHNKLATKAVIDDIKKHLPITLDSAMHRAKSIGASTDLIKHLIATRNLLVDLDKRIRGDTQITAIREIEDV